MDNSTEEKKKCSAWGEDIKELLIDKKDLTLTEKEMEYISLVKTKSTDERITDVAVKNKLTIIKKIELLKHILTKINKNPELNDKLKQIDNTGYNDILKDFSELEVNFSDGFDKTVYDDRSSIFRCKPLRELIVGLIRLLRENSNDPSIGRLLKDILSNYINSELSFMDFCDILGEEEDIKNIEFQEIKKKLKTKVLDEYNDNMATFNLFLKPTTFSGDNIEELLKNLVTIEQFKNIVESSNIDPKTSLLYIKLSYFKKIYEIKDDELLKQYIENLKNVKNSPLLEEDIDKSDVNENMMILESHITRIQKTDDIELNNLFINNAQFLTSIKNMSGGGNKEQEEEQEEEQKKKLIEAVEKTFKFNYEKNEILANIILNLKSKFEPNPEDPGRELFTKFKISMKEKDKEINEDETNETTTAAALLVFGASITAAVMPLGLALVGFGTILFFSSKFRRERNRYKFLFNHFNSMNWNYTDRYENFFQEAYNIMFPQKIGGGKRKSSKRNPKKNSNKKTRKVAKHKKKHSKNSVATQKRRRRKISRRNKSKGGKKKKRSKKYKK